MNGPADAVAALHGVIVFSVVAGQALILAGWWREWSWVRARVFRFTHLAIMAVVAVQAWLGLDCSLTVLEAKLRGESMQGPGFIATWVHRLIFFQAPAWVFTLVYSVFLVVVVWSFIACPPRGLRARRRKTAYCDKCDE